MIVVLMELIVVAYIYGVHQVDTPTTKAIFVCDCDRSCSQD